MPAAQKMMKYQHVKPAVDSILHTGNMHTQAAVPSLAPARKLARINLSKLHAAYKFICKQSSCLMERNCSHGNMHAHTTDKKHDAAKVMLTFSTPLPVKVTGVPSQRDCAHVLGIPQSTLAKREKAIIKKRQQLSTGKADIFWALAKRKKGYSKINKVIQLLLVMAFNNHPHITVSPSARDMLQLKNANGKKMAVPKLLTQVGLGTIFSNTIKDNRTIKN
jgi:hypothetical protein